MNAQLPRASARSRWRLSFAARLAIIVPVLVVETLALSFLIQATPVEATVGPAAVMRRLEHWLFRFIIAYVTSFAMLTYLGRADDRAATSAGYAGCPIRIRYGIAHVVLLAPLGLLSAALYGDVLHLPFPVLAVGWHICAGAAAVALFASMAPLAAWGQALRRSGAVLWYAVAPALAAVLAITWSQLLWTSAAKLSFRLAEILLRPFCSDLQRDPSTLTLSTHHFAVTVSDVCSGLEGVGLMLAFCAAWLWIFRREYYFPRALLIVPAALLLVFLLNAVRIAALMLIGDAGFVRVASVGFHSQAGWIAFNLAAFAVALAVKRSSWLSRRVHERAPASQNVTAPYLVPLVAILAAGMLAHAVSTGFDLLYPLRLVAGAAALWAYRATYRRLDWKFSWFAVAVGALLFVCWVLVARLLTSRSPMPDVLSQMPAAARTAWIGCRVAAAAVTVPIAEELAYRGYLLRRLANPRFDRVPFQEIRWPALALTSVAFGVAHGAMWPAGILAGLVYGLLVVRSGRIGDAAAAHATTNALLAVYVLLFGQWQLW